MSHAHENWAMAAASHLDPGHSVSSTSPRPTSSSTLRSTFADSAVDMDATPPTESLATTPTNEPKYLNPVLPLIPPDVDQTLSDKMRQLAAVAWALEQDDSMTPDKRRKLHEMLQCLEAYLDSTPGHKAEVEQVVLETDAEDGIPPDGIVDGSMAHVDVDQEIQECEEDWIEESDLIAVQDNLTATVKSMRLRQEEQRHLHQLTVQKLEAVAQRCIAQEQRARDLLREMQELRLQNHKLDTENDQLRDELASTEAEATRKEVAVEAMSSAVTGLEGWIESTTPSLPQTPAQNQKSRRQKVVIRGKGRFRGRYHVDEEGNEAELYSPVDAAAEGQELHDGVKAWLRGFRDVEEELRQHESPDRNRPQGRFRMSQSHGDDDWGDFQSPGSIAVDL